jgi:hypothetical protein
VENENCLCGIGRQREHVDAYETGKLTNLSIIFGDQDVF